MTTFDPRCELIYSLALPRRHLSHGNSDSYVFGYSSASLTVILGETKIPYFS
jgi:hypothetical protein